jgi:hypothetical protein
VYYSCINAGGLVGNFTNYHIGSGIGGAGLRYGNISLLSGGNINSSVRMGVAPNFNSTFFDETNYMTMGRLSTYHFGNFTVAGTKNFLINHPLREDYLLFHSAVESPQVNNIYRGKNHLNNGTISINLDEEYNMTEGTFLAINKDFSVFTSNETDWDAVRGKLNGNILTIECQNPNSNAEVSWLVITIRCDENIINSSLTDDNGNLIVERNKSEDGLEYGQIRETEE